MRPKAAATLRDEVVALKRERILEAAIDQFYEDGYEAATLDAVARRLRVTKPFIYTYFASKAELLAEICTRSIRSALAEIDAVLELEGDPAERLRRFAESWTLSTLRNQRHITLFLREQKNLAPEGSARIGVLVREFDRKVRGLLTEGRDARVFHLADPELVCLAIAGAVSWTAVWYRPGGRLAPAEIAERFADMILAAAGVDGARSPAKARRAEPQSGASGRKR